jgi:uncharacterized protein with HEPN domain
MLDAATEAVSFAAGRTRRDLDRDRLLNRGLVKSLEIIGEAASRVSEEVQAAHPDVPWFEIIGMRNRLIHGYFDVNLNIVWDTIHSNLPPLIETLTTLLQSE